MKKCKGLNNRFYLPSKMKKGTLISRLVATYTRRHLATHFRGELLRSMSDGLAKLLQEHLPDDIPSGIKNPTAEGGLERKTYGDITFTERGYFIGGLDSPVGFRTNTNKAKTLRYLLEHEGQELSSEGIAKASGLPHINTTLPYLMEEINNCSWIFGIEKISTGKYKVVRKNAIVEEPGHHPNFEVVEQHEDIYFGKYQYYIGSSNKGIYGRMTDADGQNLLDLCKNFENAIRLRGPSNFKHAPITVINGLPYLLAKKIEQFSEYFKLVRVFGGRSSTYYLERIK